MHEVYASLFNDRAIAYRVHNRFDHNAVALSVGVQHMVRSDLGAAGVMFTLDTDSGFRDVVFITSSYGLGETVVQGAVNPDEFYVYKPALRAGRRSVLRKNLGQKAIKMIYGDPGTQERVRTVDVAAEERQRFSIDDADIVALAKQALIIEEHYGTPMDIEWGKDGSTGKIYILQARPETVQSRAGRTIQRFTLKSRSTLLVSGRSIGQKIGAGHARVIRDVKEMSRVRAGDVLVADMTDPDWEPVMKRASAIVTNRGGRTCHAAIIARELGIPAVVGCVNATQVIRENQAVTVSCAEGDTGHVYEGMLEFDQRNIELDSLPPIPVKITMNIGNPDRAFEFAGLPNKGVGLARLEFIINRMIGVHPRALLEFAKQSPELKEAISQQIAGYPDPISFYVDKLSEGIAQIAAAFAPEPVIVRLSDFKSNEYANLIGGKNYEPHEENPMLGFRGASRYIDKAFRPCFELECRALKRVRDEMGLVNVQIMVPFVRTLDRGEDRDAASGGQRPEARRQRAQAHHDVRAAHQRRARRALPRVLRRLLDRLERHDPARARSRPRLGRGGEAVRRARRCGQGAHGHGHQGVPRAGQVRRHLRAGTLRSSRARALAGGSRHRQPIAQSRYGGRDLDVPVGRLGSCRGGLDTQGDRPPRAAAASRRAASQRPQQVLAVELQLVDRFAHIVERQMRASSSGTLGQSAAPSAAPAP